MRLLRELDHEHILTADRQGLNPLDQATVGQNFADHRSTNPNLAAAKVDGIKM